MVKKVVLQGHLIVQDADLAVILAELPKHIKLSKEEPACEVFRVSQDSKGPCKFSVFEVFTTQEGFDLHQQRVAMSVWGQVSRNVARHYNIQLVSSLDAAKQTL